MKCKQLESTAIAYLDGSLSSRQREAIASHLEECSACRERIQGLAGVMGILSEWEGIRPSPFFNTRLAQRIEQEATAARGWESLRFWSLFRPMTRPLFTTALVAVFALAIVLLQYSPAPLETVTQEPAAPMVAAVSAGGVDDLTLYSKMPMLEDWDILRNFEVLQELRDTQFVTQ